MTSATQVRLNWFAMVSLWCTSFAAGCALLAILSQPGCSANGLAGQAKTEPAKATVVAFLEALKRGDENAAKALLTKVARAKTDEMGISVAPPVNESAVYEVRECEMISDTDDLAHVGTVWTDTDEAGNRSSDNIVWAVRLDPEGWRVVGMAVRIFDDMPPLLLNFEDPEEMLAKQEMVAREIEQRQKQAAFGDAEKPRTAASEGAARNVR